MRDSGLVSALIVYVYDFGGSVGQERDTERMNEVLRIVRSFGWELVPSNLNVDIVCRIKLLGFMLDLERKARQAAATSTGLSPALRCARKARHAAATATGMSSALRCARKT